MCAALSTHYFPSSRVMSVEAEAEGSAARARPLSGGLWTLFSWLRRDDRSESSDSLSSAGSARTAASFAFFAPPPQRDRTSPLPPLAPPTDSYRKRVHDGNLRKQNDRNLTLHRKYGLYGYDAFSLPSARKHLNVGDNEQDRERRANSESFLRRAHVPGKRRAPLPPTRPHSVISTTSLNRRQTRKRPAPQPPIKFTEKAKENIETAGFEKIDLIVQMNSNSHRDRLPLSNVASNDCRSGRHNKKENNAKETKIQKEKSFLKQIFENKKRNSTLETAPERILPSISELDKQAAEIIKSCKLKPIEQNNNSSDSLPTQEEAWFCTRCLRRYDSTTVTCQHCLPEQKRLSTLLASNNLNKNAVFSGHNKDNNYTQTEKEEAVNIATNRISGIGPDEKKKLKEMLKEMKDSLPKKSKQNNSEKVENKNIFTFDSTARNSSLETPTLRVESKAKKDVTISDSQPSTSKHGDVNIKITEIKNIEKILPKTESEHFTKNVVITQHVVLVAPQPKDSPKLDFLKRYSNIETLSSASPITKDEDKSKGNVPTKLTPNVEKHNLHTPLKISSLLNPVYIPKDIALERQSPSSFFVSQNKAPIKNDSSSTAISAQQGAPLKPSSTTLSAGTSAPNSTTAKPNISTKLVIENEKLYPKSVQQVTQELEKKEITKPNLLMPALVPISTSNSANVSSDKEKLVNSNMTKFTVDQHSRRRELIIQLEQSIAKGDERAAAEAAVKLAQLRLSCSVLSFSSQIMAQTSGATQGLLSTLNKLEETLETPQPKASTSKVHTAVQSTTSGPSTTELKIKVDPGKKEAVKLEKKSTEVQTNKATPSNNKLLQDKIPEQNKDKHKPPEPSTSKQTSINNGSNLATIQIWVEDREATRGPVRLRIDRHAVMGDLRRQAETSLGLVDALQRWIVGRTLCTDDRTPLVSLAGPDLSAPFYLCIVETENSGAPRNKIDIATNKAPDQKNADKTGDVYSELVQLEQRALVVNAEPFECGICMEECADGGGAVLRECVHAFCRECMSDLVKHCEEPIVGCPAMGCPGVLQEREIRALVTPQEYERWLARGLAAAESGTRNAFHCRTRDCTGWALCDPGVRRFPCPVCKHNNCIPCQAIHQGETCEQHRKKLQEAALTPTSSQTDEGTRALLDTLITKGEALECPECSAIITKKWGCDWVKCSACKTEICWVTRGRRWGPGGKGDTSGGCRCGVDGKRCHPSCGYCH